MTSGEKERDRAVVDVCCSKPFDLSLSLRAMHSFAGAGVEDRLAATGRLQAGQAASRDVPTREAPAAAAEAHAVLRLGVRLEGRPTLLEIRQIELSPPLVRGEVHPASASVEVLSALVERVVNANLDLTPFYELAAPHPVIGPLTRSLCGLKPFRPANLFDMLVTAVIEQQISLAAAQQIRARLVHRFGAEVEGEPVFPAPSVLAVVTVDELMECGLSRRKAEYVTGVATEVLTGALDLEELAAAPSDIVRARIVSIRGFGPWSAEYVLIRGLARPDAVPIDDLAVRTVVGKLLGDGGRPSPAEAAAMLAPLAPYRGLAAFYLLVAGRLA
jgi:DNA-3-methyladenine glycosylase II